MACIAHRAPYPVWRPWDLWKKWTVRSAVSTHQGSHSRRRRGNWIISQPSAWNIFYNKTFICFPHPIYLCWDGHCLENRDLRHWSGDFPSFGVGIGVLLKLFNSQCGNLNEYVKQNAIHGHGVFYRISRKMTSVNTVVLFCFLDTRKRLSSTCQTMQLTMHVERLPNAWDRWRLRAKAVGDGVLAVVGTPLAQAARTGLAGRGGHLILVTHLWHFFCMLSA